jgi:hypothetical protein
MNEEIETIINTEDGVRVAVSEWGKDGVWLSLQFHHSSMYATITRDEAEQLLVGLQAILAKEVA